MSETITAGNLDAANLPLDMHDEALEALRTGAESAVEYERRGGCNEQATHLIYFPNAGRGGVCEGGNTDWTDCGGLEDLAHRWAHYEASWCN